MDNLRRETGELVKDFSIPNDAAAQIGRFTGLQDRGKLAELVAAVRAAGELLAVEERHDSQCDDRETVRGRLKGLQENYRNIQLALGRLDGDTLELIEQKYFANNRVWLDIGDHFDDLARVSAAIAAYREGLPAGKLKNRSLGDVLAILREAYASATGKATGHNAQYFINFLSLVGPWIGLPETDLKRHIKNMGTF